MGGPAGVALEAGSWPKPLVASGAARQEPLSLFFVLSLSLSLSSSLSLSLSVSLLAPKRHETPGH